MKNKNIHVSIVMILLTGVFGLEGSILINQSPFESYTMKMASYLGLGPSTASATPTTPQTKSRWGRAGGNVLSNSSNQTPVTNEAITTTVVQAPINQQSSAAAQDAAVTARATAIIAKAFKPLDDWMQKNVEFTPEAIKENQQLNATNRRQLLNFVYANPTATNITTQLPKAFTPIPISAQDEKSKIATIQKYVNQALTEIGSLIDNNTSAIQPLKDAARRTIEFFATDKEEVDYVVSNQALRGVIKAIKTVSLAPIKMSIIASATGIGSVAGVAGGTIAGLGAGIYRTGKDIADVNLIKEDGKVDWVGVALLVPTTTVKLLYGVVDTAVLTMYARSEGTSIGKMLSTKAAKYVTGDVWDFNSKKPSLYDLEGNQIFPSEEKVGDIELPEWKQPEITIDNQPVSVNPSERGTMPARSLQPDPNSDVAKNLAKKKEELLAKRKADEVAQQKEIAAIQAQKEIARQSQNYSAEGQGQHETSRIEGV